MDSTILYDAHQRIAALKDREFPLAVADAQRQIEGSHLLNKHSLSFEPCPEDPFPIHGAWAVRFTLGRFNDALLDINTSHWVQPDQLLALVDSSTGRIGPEGRKRVEDRGHLTRTDAETLIYWHSDPYAAWLLQLSINASFGIVDIIKSFHKKRLVKSEERVELERAILRQKSNT